MIGRSLIAALLACAIGATTALAWDPDEDWSEFVEPAFDEPAASSEGPEPESFEPVDPEELGPFAPEAREPTTPEASEPEAIVPEGPEPEPFVPEDPEPDPFVPQPEPVGDTADTSSEAFAPGAPLPEPSLFVPPPFEPSPFEREAAALGPEPPLAEALPVTELPAPPVASELPSSAPEPREIPSGIYRVTEPWVADVVERSGDLTTYRTLTERRETDAFARVLETVDTGRGSAFDGSAFNGRRTLSSGELLAGTYYEVFELQGGALVSVGVVFFQDDSELARRERADSLPRVARSAEVEPANGARIPATGTRPAIEPGARPQEQTAEAPGRVAPPAEPGGAAPPAGPDPLPEVRIGVDPTGGAALLGSLEVARGRRYELRVNVASLGRPVVLESWSLDDGVNDAANPPGWHGPAVFLAGQWLRLPPPGASWSLGLRARVSVVEPEARSLVVAGRVAIWVKAPAVVE